MKRRNRNFLIIAMLFAFIMSGSSFAGEATKWNVDKANTSINFRIWHLMTPVSGKFEDFDIAINFDPKNLEGSNIDVSIQAATINTGWGPRDEHLRTEDWFDTDEYPVMSFKSSEIISKGNDSYVARGKMNIKGVEMDVNLPFKLLGVEQITEEMKKTLGDVDEVAGFEISNFSVNRKDYHVGTGTSTPGEAAMTYRDVVGNAVNINITIEVNRKTS